MPPSFAHHIRGMLLRIPGTIPLGLRLRGCHPLWRGFPTTLRLPRGGITRVLQPHIPPWFPMVVRFALCPLQSPLLRASLLVSLPPPTKMFQFGGFPLPSFARELRVENTRREVPFGHPWFQGCLRLARAYRSLPRPSSVAKPIHPPGGVFATAVQA